MILQVPLTNSVYSARQRDHKLNQPAGQIHSDYHSSESAGEAYLKLCGASYSYQRGSFQLKETSLYLQSGEFTAITGANGSGKTTLGKLMAGIFKPDRGKVLIDGQDSRELSLGQVGQLVGYLFQQPERQLFTPTVREELGFALKFRGESRETVKRKVRGMLEEFSLSGLEESSPYQLSAGERQRLALAAVLINRPGYLILDEPTTGLDRVRKQQLSRILQGLKQEGIGLAVVSHDREFVEENADRIIVMTRGEIIAS